MNSDFDYEEFINSVFFKKGLIGFNLDTKVPFTRKNNIVQYDTTIITSSTLNNLLQDRDNGTVDTPNVRPSLYCSLLKGIIPNNVRKDIATQWMSTLNVINQLNCEYESSFMLIGIGGSYLDRHKHAKFIKQTLTFQFDFPEFTNPKSNQDSYINLYDDSGNVTHQLAKNKTNKSVFTISDNIRHDAYFKNLRFYWIYDFEEYLDLESVDFGDFEFLKFENTSVVGQRPKVYEKKRPPPLLVNY